jgi:O-Antigen ligase
MSGEIVETAAPVLAGPSEEAPAYVGRAASWLPGVGSALLVCALGFSHGGYFQTAWGPLTLAFLAVAALAVVVSPPALGWRELAVPGLLAAIAVWALASASWGSATEAVPEAQRALAYAAGALAFALVLRRERVEAFLVGLWVGISIVAIAALAGRLFPERFGEYDPIGVYRLSEPVGYWNALGVLAAFGLVLAVSLVARAQNLAVRLAAAGSTVPLALTLYFTFSRGAWLALLAGLALVLVLDPRRLQLATMLLIVAPWPALAVWLASRSEPLTEVGHPLAAASADGHALVAVAVGLALMACASTAFGVGAARRVRISLRTALIGNVALLASLAAALALVVVALGGPSEIARSFAAPPRAIDGDLDERLFDLSGNGRVDGWRVALDRAGEHPLIGGGGGSFERTWLAERPNRLVIRDAHSLYLEVLAEYGALGLALVVALFALPLVLAVRYRRRPLVTGAAGVLTIYAVHAGFDWDWEFPLLMLVALASAAAIMSSGRTRAERGRGRSRVALITLVVALVPVALLGALGARAQAASANAFEARDYERAISRARSAERLVPWSVQPLLLLGRAQAGAGNRAAASRTFRRALREDRWSWRLWYELAAVSQGAERRAALREARSLNPLEPLLAGLDQRP